MFESLKGLFSGPLLGDQGQGLHKDFAGLVTLWGWWGVVGKRLDSLRVCTQLPTFWACIRILYWDLWMSIWRIALQDFLRSRELEEASLFFWSSAEFELAKREVKEASSAPSSHSPLPWGPRKWVALCRQVEKPSWKECLWPPPPPPPLAASWRKSTVCSSISAFSTLRWVSSYNRDIQLINRFMLHWFQAFNLVEWTNWEPEHCDIYLPL